MLGPKVIVKCDYDLAAVDGIWLDDVTLDLVLSTMQSFARGTRRSD